VSAVEANDRYTAGHSQRVADTACSLARELGWGHSEIEKLRLAALLHDIGKIGINPNILNKPGPLDDAEWEEIRQHTVIGARILSSIPGCEEIAQTVLHHHEALDGSGYPEHLAEGAIPPAARIVAIADIYDALTSKRSYRDAYSPERALAILEESAGDTLDAELVGTFAAMVRRNRLAPEPDDSRAVPQPDAAGLVLVAHGKESI
jgi:putative nucleotidyltransferase with HDIG domain